MLLWIIRYFNQARSTLSIENTLLILDNAPYHISESTKGKILKLNLNAIYLPPYSPILAPVEQFFMLIKFKIKFINKSKGVNFNSKGGVEAICHSWDLLKYSAFRYI